VFNGVVGGFPILRVCDSSIGIAFGEPLFDILTRVPYYSYSVIRLYC
jgi:hypothetical protein